MGCDGFLLGGKDHSQSCIRIRKIVGIQSTWKLNDWVTEVVLKKLWNMKFCDMMTCASCGNALCSLSGFASHCLVREMDHGMQTMQAEHNIENTSRQTQYKTMSHILYRPHYWKISSFLSNSTLKLLKTLNTVQQILKSTHSPPSKKKKVVFSRHADETPFVCFFFVPGEAGREPLSVALILPMWLGSPAMNAVA